eukprot:NODE_8_length_66115_cov_0.981823.p45 type:complete len:150 gc:universal NODE_8_length_66115_cov_0.981823:35939-35490(-)
MKLYGVITFSPKPDCKVKQSAFDLYDFSYFQRSSVQEFMNFAAKTIADRTLPGQRQSVKQDTYMIHCYCQSGDVAVCITDQSYPSRVAYHLLTKALTASQIEALLKEYQKPEQVDQLLGVQKELDETKVVLHDTINSVLERGQKYLKFT